MRRLPFQRWTVILLLLSRLVFGELAHALPHAEAGMADPAAATQPAHAAHGENSTPPCSEHDTADHKGNSAGEHDCCKANACDCPCAHLPQASLLTSSLSFERAHLAPPAPDGDGLALPRISTLFRPPA